jgi:hypothetical protein
VNDEPGDLSLRLAERERKGHHEKLVTEVMADVQYLAAAIFQAVRQGERLHDTRRVVMRLSQVAHCGAEASSQNSLRIGAVKIDRVILRHL